MYKEAEVYIPGHGFWMGVLMLIIQGFSLNLRISLMSFMMGSGFKNFQGRNLDQQT